MMGLFEQFPYTNFHELNLDWLLEELRKVINSEENLNKEFPELKQFVLDYFKNLDVDDKVREAIQTMIDDGTMEQIITDALSVIITPEMFGAVGDGVTDDTEAFQAALDNSNKNLLCSKTYFISDELKIGASKNIFGGGTIYRNSSTLEQKKLFYTEGADNVKNLKIDNIKFLTYRDRDNVYPPSGHTRPAGSKSSNIVFLSLTNVDKVEICNCDFDNSEFDVDLYECESVIIRGFKSRNASMFTYVRGCDNVIYKDGEITLYDKLGEGDHDFYIAYENDNITIDHVNIYSLVANGRYPIHCYASAAQLATYDNTKNIKVNNCYIEFDYCIAAAYSNIATFSNCTFKALATTDYYNQFVHTYGDIRTSVYFNECTFNGSPSYMLGDKINTAKIEFKGCLFNGKIDSENCPSGSEALFIGCTIRSNTATAIGSRATSYIKTKFIGCFVYNAYTESNTTVVYTTSLEPLFFQNCYFEGTCPDGLMSVRVSGLEVVFMGCYGVNKYSGATKYFEYNGAYAPAIKVYNSAFPGIKIRTAAHVTAANSTFAA